MTDLFSNFPLWAALIAIGFAQVIKIPIKLLLSKEFNFRLAFSTGGMPSSHSAAVTALTTAIGLVDGVDSTLFAISVIFSVVTMFDASGVRKHAGEQAAVLNWLIRDFQFFLENTDGRNKKPGYDRQKELKELLGHQPIEVIIGGATGVIIAFLLFPLFS